MVAVTSLENALQTDWANVFMVVQFYPWFKFDFPLFLDMVMCGNEFETKENQN